MVLYVSCFDVCFLFSTSMFQVPVKVIEWSPFWKELLTWLIVHSHCKLSICNFSYFPFWNRGQEFGSDCTGFWSV